MYNYDNAEIQRRWNIGGGGGAGGGAEKIK